MRTITFLLLSFFSLAISQELIVGNCAENIVTNKYGKFSQRFCDAYLNGKRVGMLKIEEHINPPFYGMVGGYLEIGNKVYKANYFTGKYFAIYEPYGNGLKIETMCGFIYTKTDNLKEVWKAILNCIKDK